MKIVKRVRCFAQGGGEGIDALRCNARVCMQEPDKRATGGVCTRILLGRSALPGVDHSDTVVMQNLIGGVAAGNQDDLRFRGQG